MLYKFKLSYAQTLLLILRHKISRALNSHMRSTRLEQKSLAALKTRYKEECSSIRNTTVLMIKSNV